MLSVRCEPINATPAEIAVFRDGIASMGQGWGQTLDSLAQHLER